MKVTITPTRLHGSITPPPSKSQAHRLVLAAALGEGESVLDNLALSQDIRATLSCVEQLGAVWEELGEKTIRIRGIGSGKRSEGKTGEDALPHFDCGESGSTLRFLIPIALAVAGGGVFTGRGRLMERPQQPYFDLFDEKGIEYRQENGVLTVRGTLKAGEYRLAGDVSSQFFTGLLYALSLCEGSSRIISTTRLESSDYITMTLDALQLAGISAGWLDGVPGFFVESGTYQPIRAAVEADWSQAGFWYAAQGIGNEVTVTGMDLSSHQGDRAILSWGEQIKGDQAHTATIDVSRCPDLVPPAAVWGALMNGTLSLTNAGRLRIKESDRLVSVHQTLERLGAKVQEEPEQLILEGVKGLKGGVTVDCFNDHRIAMMAAIAATRCEEPVTLLGAECVKKSYPDFWDDYERLGGVIEKEF